METIENTKSSDPSQKVPLQNSTAILVLGIFSIVTSWCCGFIAIVGLVLGIVALTLASKATTIYQENPERYTESSFKNVNAGKICAIIGIVISGILILIGLVYLFVVGATLGTLFGVLPWENIINY